MESIIATFHIDWKIMIAQLVNFGVVVFVLWYFVFKPLGQKMNERTKTIEKSLDEARQIAENLKQAESEKHQIVKQARLEAQHIVDDARTQAETDRQKNVAAARAEVKKIIDMGKNQLADEKEKMIHEVRADIGGLVAAAVTKVLGTVVDKKVDRALVEKAIKETNLKNQTHGNESQH